MFLDSGKCFWIVGSVLNCGKCFWILGRVFGFWDVFLDSGTCFGFWDVFLDSGKCFVPTSHRKPELKLQKFLKSISYCELEEYRWSANVIFKL